MNETLEVCAPIRFIFGNVGHCLFIKCNQNLNSFFFYLCADQNFFFQDIALNSMLLGELFKVIMLLDATMYFQNVNQSTLLEMLTNVRFKRNSSTFYFCVWIFNEKLISFILISNLNDS